MYFVLLIATNCVLIVNCSLTAKEAFYWGFTMKGVALNFAVLVNIVCALIAIAYIATHI